MAWTQQLKSGNWQGLYRDANGKPRGAGSYPHKAKALAMAMLKEEESRLPGWRDPRAAQRRWGDWCDEWLSRRNVADSGYRADMSQLRTRIRPRWDDVPLADITRGDIKAWVAAMVKSGYAESSAARALRVFSASLSAAIDAEVLHTNNPAYRLGFTPGETDVVRFFTRKQIRKTLARLEHRPKDQAIIAVLVGCGLRPGEMAGLSPERVNLKRRTLRVTQTKNAHTGKLKPYPKGKKVRDVPIPEWVVDMIRPYVEAGDELVFPGFHLSNWRRDVWSKYGPGRRPYDLRHTFASWLLQDGVSLAEVARLMGHSSQRVTERYAHLVKEWSPNVAKALRDPRV